MKNLFLIATLALGLFASDKLAFEADPLKALEKGKKENKKVVMFIYSTSCGWCAKMKNTTFKDEKLIKLLNQKFVFSPVNQDAGVLPPHLLPEFVPMTYIIDTKSNKITSSIAGFKNTDDFIAELPK